MDNNVKYLVAKNYRSDDRLHKRAEELPLVTTVRMERSNSFVKMEVFSRGTQCGTMVVPQGDAIFIASRLFKGEYEEYVP